MYLTAQRVISACGENGINGFLYEHGAVTWESPPEPGNGAVGELVHTFVMVPPGGNKVVSYVDIVAPDGAPYDDVRSRVLACLVRRANEQLPLPWVGVDGDVRFGLNMIPAYARDWRSEVTKLLTACQMTLDRYRCEAS